MAEAHGINAYLAGKKEATENTPVIPDTYIEAYEVEENVGYIQNYMTVAAATREKHRRATIGKNEAPTLTIKGPVQAKTIPHLLQMAYGPVSTSGPSDTSAYTHTFNVGAPVSYSLDVATKSRSEVHRYIGNKASKLAFSFSNDVLEYELTTMAQSAFIATRVTTTASSGTALVVASTRGLVTGDTIVVSKGDSTNEAEYSITVNSETSITLGSSITGKTHSSGDRVVLKTGTPSWSVGSTFTMPGASTFSIGTSIGAVSAYDAEEFSFEFARDLEARYALTGTAESDRFPVAILPKSVAASSTFKWFYQDPKWIDYIRGRTPLAATMSCQGASLAGAASVYDSITIAMPELYFEPSVPKFIAGDNIVEQEMNGTCVYNDSAGYASRITVVNGTSSY